MGLTTKTLANPAPGVEVVVTVPALKWWRIWTVHLKLVASAVAANRLVRLLIDDGTNPLYKVPNDVNHVANQTTEYSYGNAALSEAAQGATSVARVYPLPTIVLAPASRIQTVTAGKDAGDQFSEIAMLVEEYSSDPTLRMYGNSGTLIP